jgi:FkbM family methyltransferase
MGWSQAINSVTRIINNPFVRTVPALYRYVSWQGRRVLRAFPTELPLSESILIAPSGYCGVSALVNAHGEYDFNNMQFIKDMLRHGGDFIDIGANIGAYTLIAAEQQQARVLAVEAHPGTFKHLGRNVARNGYRNVHLICAAAGATEGHVRITDTPGSSTTHITQNGIGVDVPLRRMDALLAETGLSPDVVKIDVEGFELAVLKGFGAALGDIKVLFVEINKLGDQRESPLEELMSLLRAAGFLEPKFYDCRSRHLGTHPVLRGEDPLWVHTSYRAALERDHGIGIGN